MKENGKLKDFTTSYEDLELENKQLKHLIMNLIEDKKNIKDIQGHVAADLLSRSSPDGQYEESDHQSFEDEVDKNLENQKKEDHKQRWR